MFLAAIYARFGPKQLDSAVKIPYEPPIRMTGVSDRPAPRSRRLPFRYQPRPGDGVCKSLDNRSYEKIERIENEYYRTAQC